MIIYICSFAYLIIMKLIFPIKTLLFFVLAYFIYSFAVYTQVMHTKEARNKISTLAIEGKDIFQKNNCISCHQIYGLGGYLGPDLTNTISEKGEKYAETFIRNGSSRMPKFDLTDAEVQALIELLKEVNSSGKFPILDFDVNWNGTIEIKNKK